MTPAKSRHGNLYHTKLVILRRGTTRHQWRIVDVFGAELAGGMENSPSACRKAARKARKGVREMADRSAIKMRSYGVPKNLRMVVDAK